MACQVITAWTLANGFPHDPSLHLSTQKDTQKITPAMFNNSCTWATVLGMVWLETSLPCFVPGQSRKGRDTYPGYAEASGEIGPQPRVWKEGRKPTLLKAKVRHSLDGRVTLLHEFVEVDQEGLLLFLLSAQHLLVFGLLRWALWLGFGDRIRLGCWRFLKGAQKHTVQAFTNCNGEIKKPQWERWRDYRVPPPVSADLRINYRVPPPVSADLKWLWIHISANLYIWGCPGTTPPWEKNNQESQQDLNFGPNSR